MKLATVENGTKDGSLRVVSRDNQRMAAVAEVPTVQFALDHWERVIDLLQRVSEQLNSGQLNGESTEGVSFLAPLPRAYEWVDASAYINHVALVRKARGAPLPENLKTDPLVYQGGSGVMLGHLAPIELKDTAWGCDFESEVAVILGDTPQCTSVEQAEKHIRLVLLANDVSLRNLIPNELAKGFGFFQSKPATGFSPFAVTPDELGVAWKGGRIHLPLHTHLNGVLFGNPDAGSEMHFSFWDLISFISQTRSFTAGTVLGSGTVSNEDRSRGSSCLAEKRMLEQIDTGSPKTPFLQFGDRVEIEMFDASGLSIFGKICQTVTKLS